MLATWGCTTFPKPTLSLDFLGATSLDSGITFSRGSQATLFDSTGTLRYAKHNLLTYSQDFGDSAWTKNNSSALTDVTTAPDGTSTADSLADNTTNDVHNVTRSIAWTVGAVTASFFVKYFNHRWIQVRIGASGNQFWGSFDLLNGVVGSATAGATTTMTSVGNGWYRITVSATLTTAGSANLLFQLGNADVTALASYVGTGTLVYLWGAQLNLANMEGGVTSSLTTYYPTTAAAYYAPRFDYNPSTLQPRGLLIEEQRTNSIRNNTMQGAVAGTPGTNPTNWSRSVSPTSGISNEIVGTGTESGITYIDLRFTGTATATIGFSINLETSSGAAASASQTWTTSTYAKLQAGSLNGSTFQFVLNEYSSVPAFLRNTFSSTVTPTTAALNTQRRTFTVTTGASTAFVQPVVYVIFTNGQTYDFTLRIGLPQLEQGAFATSVIPTTTTALTRNADVASMTGTNFSSWYSASEGTLLAQITAAQNISTAYVTLSNGNQTQNSVYFDNDSGNMRNVVFSSSSAVAVLNLGSIGTVGAVSRLAAAYQVNNFAAVRNGGAVLTDTSGAVPSGVSQMNIGASTAGAAASYINGYIQRISFWPTRLPNATLQALTS